MSAKRTQDQIDYLLQYPHVFKHVSDKRTVFTLEFRSFVWEFSNHEPTSTAVRQALNEKCHDPKVAAVLGSESIRGLARHMKQHGTPRGAANTDFGIRKYPNIDPEYNQMLLEQGYLVKDRHGYCFSEKFKLILVQRELGSTVEQALAQAGIDPKRLGYQRLRKLIRDDRDGLVYRHTTPLSPDDLVLLGSNPFISSVTDKKIHYRKSFDQWSGKLRASVSAVQIAELFGLGLDQLSDGARLRILNRIRYYRSSSDEVIHSDDLPDIPGTPEESIRFLSAYLKIMVTRTSETMDQIRTLWPKLQCLEKKEAARIIQAGTGENGFTLSSLLQAASIPRSSWYGMNSEGYGQFVSEKKEQDRKDFEAIEEIMNYKGFRKGSRQIRLQLKEKKGITMGLSKIRRLMKENGVESGIRKKTRSKSTLLDNVQPNLLRRRFRLNRPGEVTLTDVTYLDYGPEKQRAYMSALKDPATGVVLDLLVSDSQDIDLGEATIRALPDCEEGLFHSDQGVLYLNGTFQAHLRAKGYEQSMSRRGNCWDNSSMESFFGHFKDECPYQTCQTLDELRTLVSEYASYYNEERPQPCRRNMTPVDYAEWLNSLDQEEWSEHIRKETEKYNKMLEDAAESAVERARIDKAVAGESEYGQRKKEYEET